MSISPNLNMIIGGIQVAQLSGAAAVSIFNLVYEGRELAHTHDAFAKISELRPLAQAMNIRLTPNAPRLQPAGTKTELAFSPFEALSLFHIIGQNITLRQTELSFVTSRIAAADAHEEEDDQDLSNEDIAATIAEHLSKDEMQALLNKLGEIAEEEEDYTIALALINVHGAPKVIEALAELDIHLDLGGEDPDLSEAEIAQAENLEFAAEIQDQLTDDQITKLIKEFITEEDEDDEDDVLLDLIIERHGITAVGQKITDLGFEFSSDLDPDEDAADDEEEDDFDKTDDEDFGPDEEEDDSDDHGLSDYAVTVLRNDLTALHHNDRVIIANEVGVTVGRDTAELVEELMEHVSDVLDALEEHDIKLPNFDAVMRATDEDEDREERLHRLDIQDLEILCDVLGINRVDQDHDELIDLLCTRPQGEFVSALFIADITLPSLNYESDEPTIDEYRANFEHIAALTMLQSAVATCIADGQQDLVLSFTH